MTPAPPSQPGSANDGVPAPTDLLLVVAGRAAWDGPWLPAKPVCTPDTTPAAVRRLLGAAPAALILLAPSAATPAADPDLVAALRRELPDCELVLVYGDRGAVDPDADALAACYRAGLHDAVSLRATPDVWRRQLARAVERGARRLESGQLAQQQLSASRRLKQHHKRLQDDLTRAGADLADSHLRLEQANLDLNRHMNQLALLYSFGRELSTARNWDLTLESILKTLAGFIGAEGAALVLRPGPDAPFAPRQTYRWDDPAWERVLDRLEREQEDGDPDGLLVLRTGDAGPTVTALPLDHMRRRLGYLLLLGYDPGESEAAAVPAFLRTVQVILSEEVASAQILDRMRELGAFNSRVLETVQNGIWVLDETGATVYCNRTAREFLTGVPEAARIVAEPDYGIGRGRAAGGERAAAGFFRRDAFRLEDLPELCLDARLRLDPGEGTVLSRLAGEGGETFRAEGRLLRAGDESLPVLVQSSAMRGRTPGETWLVVVLEDLRPARRLAAETRRADALQGLVEMSATLAHEIRNPLMGLSAQAELLADSLGADDHRRRYLDVITGEVDRINATITRMLNYVRPYEPDLARVDLAPLARDCLQLAEARARQADVSLATDLPDSPVLLSADGAQITQVLLNLLLNALDAAPAGSEVVVELEGVAPRELVDADTGASRVAPACRLAVRDRGPGFAPADLDKLFRPFFTTKSAGTGLGLSLCRKIVAAHRGAIGARREGGDTVFEILLPADAGAQAREQEST
ncbi:MAG: PAS domain-containing protein [bacterium]|nr:PAS domain-containing protein [bacterium]